MSEQSRLDEVTTVQNMSLSGIESQIIGSPPVGHLDKLDIIKKLLVSKSEFYKLNISQIQKVFSDVDFDHPDFFEVEFLKEDSSSNDKGWVNLLLSLHEAITVESYLNKTENLKRIPALLKSFFDREFERYRFKLKRMPVRMRASNESREKTRLNKKGVKVIRLDNCFEKSSYFRNWNEVVDTLQFFARNNDYAKKAAQLREKADQFKEMGLIEQAKNLYNHTAKMHTFNEKQYKGFYKLRMMDASLILAKNLGYVFSAIRKEDKKPCIYVHDGYYRSQKFVFWEPAKCLDSVNPVFSFEPRAYPLHEFSANIPERMSHILNLVDNHPDVNYKPLFDYYWVLCPGVNFPNGRELLRNGKCYIYKNDHKLNFEVLDSAKKTLDILMTEQKIFAPILLGEKDGFTYFISYWN